MPRSIVRLADELHHFDCLSADIGEHLTRTLDEVDESELASLALSGADPRCFTCGASLSPDPYTDSDPGEADV